MASWWRGGFSCVVSSRSLAASRIRRQSVEQLRSRQSVWGRAPKAGPHKREAAQLMTKAELLFAASRSTGLGEPFLPAIRRLR
jgi:hypothetical protein